MAGGKKTPTDFKARAKAKTKVAPKKKRMGISARRAHNPTATAAATEVVVADAEPSDDEPIDEEDMEFVRENAKSLSFLSSVNPEKLAKIAKEAKVKGMRNRDKPKVAAPAELSDTEDEEDEADSEDMGIVAEDSDSDLEVYSEDDQVDDLVVSDSEAESMGEEDEYEFRNSKSRRVQKRKAMMDGAMSYEQGTRAFEQTEKRAKVSNRLPTKTADGRLVVSDAESDQDDGGDESDKAEDDKMDVSDDDELVESESESEDEVDSEG
ncbi:hypothetical protein GGI08_001642, partial [Coemansia sp. S2]